jgi:hypothetical protein
VLFEVEKHRQIAHDGDGPNQAIPVAIGSSARTRGWELAERVGSTYPS